MRLPRFSLFSALAFALTCAASFAQAGAPLVPIDAPNVVEITPLLTTSGQPTAKALESLSARGYEAVIYLAPPSVGDAVKEEAVIVGRQGMVFINLPMIFNNPTEKDVEAFNALLSGLNKRKVLVHCQINMRASTMVFLYRVLANKEDPQLAYSSVTKVWSPEGVWKKLAQEELRKNGINFELY